MKLRDITTDSLESVAGWIMGVARQAVPGEEYTVLFRLIEDIYQELKRRGDGTVSGMPDTIGRSGAVELNDADENEGSLILSFSIKVEVTKSNVQVRVDEGIPDKIGRCIWGALTEFIAVAADIAAKGLESE